MKPTIVGGNWQEPIFGDKTLKKESSIIIKLARFFEVPTVYNGGDVKDLPEKVDGLTIWMPNISNAVTKQYPIKKVGSCLIVSKVVRRAESTERLIEKALTGHHKYFEAVQRIFKMRANAVIAIENTPNFKTFSLIDALGNIWITTCNTSALANTIHTFYNWNSQQKRVSTPKHTEIEEFMHLVRENAKNIMEGTSDRYFGNCSTRCMSTFPSVRSESGCLVSPRNVSKLELEAGDMVYVTNDGYVGDNKPSVDTPVQLELYKKLPKINFMIHGHAFFKEGRSTEHYYPCGDLREVEEILKITKPLATLFAINLKNHGFLIGADTVGTLEWFLADNVPIMEPFRKMA